MSVMTERQLPCADCPNMAEGDCSMRCEVWEAAYLDLFDEADELAAENAQKDIAITSLMQRVERVLVENTRLREENERLTLLEGEARICSNCGAEMATAKTWGRLAAAEAVCEATHEHVFGHHHGRDGIHNQLCDALAAWQEVKEEK